MNYRLLSKMGMQDSDELKVHNKILHKKDEIFQSERKNRPKRRKR